MKSRSQVVIAMALGLLLPLAAGAVITVDDPGKYLIPSTRNVGVAQLLIGFEDGSTETCSGTAVSGVVVTAAHCLENSSNPGRGKYQSVHVAFPTGGGTVVQATSVDIHADWTGSVESSPADIAKVFLPGGLPSGVRAFELTPFDITVFPIQFELAGFGDAGKGGVDPSLQPQPGPGGAIPIGTARLGANHYDEVPAGMIANAAGYLVYDFDNYSADANVIGEPGWVTVETSSGSIESRPQIIDQAGNTTDAESMAVGGDSGGPSFIDSIFLVGIHSWYTDAKPGELGGVALYPGQLALGEPGHGSLAGDVNVARYADWIRSTDPGQALPDIVPLPGGLVLLASALLGLAVRRHR